MTTGTETAERRSFVDALRAFAARECGTRAQRAALTGGGREAHNPHIGAALGELGWIGCGLPEEYGGAGGGVTDTCLLLEELNHGMVPVFGLPISLIVAKAALRYGTEQQRHDIVGGICRGEVAAVAMSEPDAGSDVGSMVCRAERTEGGYRLNGQKTWISCAHYASRILLVARTDPAGAKHEGLTMFDLRVPAEGVDVRPIDTLGGREVNDVYLTDVFVRDEDVIGTPGQAWRQLMSGLNFERLVCAAWFLGHARRTFDDALAYVREREQFGRPIGRFQTIKHRIADLATELECCRLLVYDVARRTDAEPDRQLPREASMAKLKVTELAKQMALEGMQMMGGAGYTTEHDMERHLRTAVISTVFAGTSEIQREIVAKSYQL